MFYRITKRVYCLIAFLLFSCVSGAFAQVKDPLKHQLTVTVASDSLIKSLLKLEQHTGFNFAFDPDQLRHKRSATFHFVHTPLETILTKVLFGTGHNQHQLLLHP